MHFSQLGSLHSFCTLPRNSIFFTIFSPLFYGLCQVTANADVNDLNLKDGGNKIILFTRDTVAMNSGPRTVSRFARQILTANVGFSPPSFLQRMAKWSESHNGKYPDPYAKLPDLEEREKKEKKKKKKKKKEREKLKQLEASKRLKVGKKQVSSSSLYFHLYPGRQIIAGFACV